MTTEKSKPQKRFLGRGLPYINLENLEGQLVVIEGSDGVGRSTQIGMLRNWLEVQGCGVAETGWTRSLLMSQTIDLAKEGHKMNALTFNLLYATDFADRLEHEIIPALRAGFIVLADRYVYTAFARALVRGADPDWIWNLYGFALEPDLILYLQVDVGTLINRKLGSGEMDYWEAGLDQNPGLDPYDSFMRYQKKMLREFNQMSKVHGFKTVDARRDIAALQTDLRKVIARHLGWEETDRIILPDEMGSAYEGGATQDFP